MDLDAKIYVAGHRGMVGSAIVRKLQKEGYHRLVLRTSSELDLRDGATVRTFFDAERPDYVFLAAAKVGGILANDTAPAEFIYDNLAIQTNVIHEAYRNKVKKLLFLGSSCIYPRDCPQPIKEQYLLTGPLEPTNRAYAVAKIAGIEMCRAYNQQYGTKYLAAMPTNLYGPGDNYDLETSHVLPALVRKMHEAKVRGDREVVVWGTGMPRREFLYCDDLADACLFLMNLPAETLYSLLGSGKAVTGTFEPPLVNIGVGEDIPIAELAQLVKKIIGFEGQISFDTNKPDGTPRKLLEVSRINGLGWKFTTSLREGIDQTYQRFMSARRDTFQGERN